MKSDGNRTTQTAALVSAAASTAARSEGQAGQLLRRGLALLRGHEGQELAQLGLGRARGVEREVVVLLKGRVGRSAGGAVGGQQRSSARRLGSAAAGEEQ